MMGMGIGYPPRMDTGPDPVASEPRLFVGQVPTDKTEEDLLPLFAPYGTLRNLHLITGPEGRSRGCAMVLYDKWAQAEAAMEAHDGQTVLPGGKGRPLVVSFANPRKATPGQPPEQGVAPKKLFVGQVPRGVTEQMLRPFFEPYGEIEHLNILRTQRGQSAGCAFVQYRKWAQAEAAMEAHNGKTRMHSSDVPLVVKFADAKRKEDRLGFGRGRLGMDWQEQMKRLQLAGNLNEYAAQGLLQGQGVGYGSNPLGGYGATGLNSYSAGGLNKYGGLGGSLINDLGNMNLGNMGSGVGNGVNDNSLAAFNTLSLGSGSEASSSAAAYGGGQGDVSGLLSSQFAGLSGLGGEGPSMSAGLPGYAENLGAQQGIPGGYHNPVFDPSGQSHLFNTSAALSSAQDALGSALSGYPGYGNDGSGLGGQAGPSGLNLHPMHSQLRMPSGGIVNRMGRGVEPMDAEKYNQWKLFIGQVPLEATEEDLWAMFAPIGDILELYILRNANGKSRGCAFVTYASKHLAQQAITHLNGRHVPPGKTLVVKFADRAIAGKVV